MSDGYTESTIEVAGLPIQVLRGGDGPSVLVIHHETGNPGWLEFHNALSGSRDVILPTLPGWDGTERADWMRSVRDLAAVCSLLLDELGVGDVTLVGLGFGGYIAAEMATANQSRLSSLVLVNAVGLQPEEGEIRDQFLEAHADYVKSCFADPANFTDLYGEEIATEQLVAWDANREMTARTAWKTLPLQPDAPASAAQREDPNQSHPWNPGHRRTRHRRQPVCDPPRRRRTDRDRGRPQPRIRRPRSPGRGNRGLSRGGGACSRRPSLLHLR